MHEDKILEFIFSHTFSFGMLFGALGGLVHELDLHRSTEISDLTRRLIISGGVGALAFLLAHDVEFLTPAMRLTICFTAGFSGSVIIRRYSKMVFSNYPKKKEHKKEGG